MKKLYLVFLALVLLFIPTTYGIAVYQLDQPVKELNNHTLREVFEENNYLYNRSPDNIDMTKVELITFITNGFEILSNATTSTFITIRFNQELNSGDKLYSYGESFSTSNSKRFQMQTEFPNFDILNYVISNTYDRYSNIDTLDTNKTQIKFQVSKLTTDVNILQGYKNYGVVNMTTLGISSLNVEQMDTYYDLYLEAVRFENENIEASQDPGGYESIFKSIISGVRTLMRSMEGVFDFLNAPLLEPVMQEINLNIDWSWDLVNVIKQIFNLQGKLILNGFFIVPFLWGQILGISVHVSILTLLFSNIVFVVLGWIMVKSFIL